jgi:predicted XRE-type DNA-binding protein
MPSANAIDAQGHITTGSVLEDLGFSAEEIREMEIKRGLRVPIHVGIEARKLTQAKLAKELQIHQPDASLLLRGQIARFSITRLMQFAESFHLSVSVAVAPRAGNREGHRASRIPMRKPSSRRPGGRRADNSPGSRKAALA